MKESKWPVGRLVQMRREKKLSGGMCLPKGYVFKIGDAGPRGVTLAETEPGAGIAARRVARRDLLLLPERRATVQAWCDNDDEADYRMIESVIRRELTDRRGVDVGFFRPCRPQDALQRPADIYVIDYGGAGVLGGPVGHVIRPLIKLAQERPNTLVLIWTAFTGSYLLEELEDQALDLVSLPNIAFKAGTLRDHNYDRSEARFQDALTLWFGDVVDGGD